MPVKGEFVADFASFSAAVDGSVAKLKEFEGDSEKVAKSLSRMSDSISGVKIQQEAALAAKAVADLGGVSKLTDTNLQRLGSIAAEAAQSLERLGQDVPPQIRELADAFEATKAPTEGFAARVTGLVAAGAAARDAMRGVITMGSEWVKEATEAEDAAVRLDTALRAQGQNTPVVAAQFAALAKEFQNTTVYGDDLIVEMQALLVTVGSVMPQDMKRALASATDLAAALRIDLPSATMMVAKALEGNSTALKKAGVDVDDLAFKTDGASAVFDAIAKKMGGAAKDQAATLGGEMQRLGNSIGDVKESLGGLIAKGLQPALDLFLGLPAPVRDGAIAAGLLSAAAIALGIAIAGVGAALALAAPLLGFSAATAGAVALGGLGTAATALAAAFWPVSAAIAAVWAAWEIGNIEGVKNKIAEWSLRLGGMTAEQAKAAIAATAAAEATAELAKGLGTVDRSTSGVTASTATYVAQLNAAVSAVNAMTSAQKEEILAAKALGMNEADLIEKFKAVGLTHAGLALILEQQAAAAAGTKKSIADLAAAHQKAAVEAKKNAEAHEAVLLAIEAITQPTRDAVFLLGDLSKVGEVVAVTFTKIVDQMELLMDAEHKLAIAEDARAQAAAHANDADQRSIDLAKEKNGVFAGESVPTASSLSAAGRRPGSFLGQSTGQMVGSMLTNITATPWDANYGYGYGGARAGGGPVSAGSSYMVGERGPELFTPRNGGSILPNGGGTSLVVNVTVNGSVLSNKEELARVVADAFGARLRSQGLHLPTRA